MGDNRQKLLLAAVAACALLVSLDGTGGRRRRRRLVATRLRLGSFESARGSGQKRGPGNHLLASGNVVELKVGSKTNSQFVGYFANEPYYADFGGALPEPTAANVQAALEGVYGAGNVSVTGTGPGGESPLTVTSIGEDANRSVPLILVDLRSRR